MGHFLVFWDRFLGRWDTFLFIGTHACVLGHILIFWDTFLCFGTHSCFLGHILVFWDTFLRVWDTFLRFWDTCLPILTLLSDRWELLGSILEDTILVSSKSSTIGYRTQQTLRNILPEHKQHHPSLVASGAQEAAQNTSSRLVDSSSSISISISGPLEIPSAFPSHPGCWIIYDTVSVRFSF